MSGICEFGVEFTAPRLGRFGAVENGTILRSFSKTHLKQCSFLWPKLSQIQLKLI